MAKKKLDRPRRVRTSLEELEVIMRFKESVEWAVLKRLMQRYLNNLMRGSFNLSYGYSEEDFKVRHREYTAEARALKWLAYMVNNAGKKHEEMEERKKKK